MNQTVLLSLLVVFLQGGASAFHNHFMTTRHLQNKSWLKSSVQKDISSNSERLGVDGTEVIDLPPILSQIVDERRQFELNLGKAMDVLRGDYPDMIHTTPDFSIYHDGIEVVDPSGVQIRGIGNYKSSFKFVQTMAKLFYNMDESSIQNRMMYDFARQSIRISWNCVLVPKVVGNSRNAMYIDGISIYKLDSTSGKIIEHTVEKVLVNNIPMTQPNLFLSVLRSESMQPNAGQIPVF
uniref:SnoaL-like domain-containing protein n=1 Tax=Eucampia antarctica TaxID=49252 RepID=A0A7S2RAM5_9STRA|mmetsp:Transcript_19655/g.18864  ORF Transcript_19655/g.18864 Transcript_19655/m.18864 type:complete len:237 (+) Transcript_19655:133-843(+)